MRQWDYLLVDAPRDAVTVERKLKELGMVGWELVQVLGGLLWLKREMSEGETTGCTPQAQAALSSPAVSLFQVLSDLARRVDLKEARNLRGVVQFDTPEEGSFHMVMAAEGWELHREGHLEPDAGVAGSITDILDLLNLRIHMSSQRLHVHGRRSLLGSALLHLRAAT